MSALPSFQPVTFEEFEQMPYTQGVQELLDGIVVEMPPPKARHGTICTKIFLRLSRHVHEERLFSDVGYLIAGNWLIPDVSVSHPDQGDERGFMTGAPMIAVEVASKGNTPNELEYKKKLYLENGAAEVWMVYDKTRTVVLHIGREAVTYDGAMPSRALGATIDVSEFFR